ncbi:uncharacterized protein LOC107612282 [Arachis ipaensis]|uniref:uncharacterized protein LOC107612282 n=1 Tax=Arachis ipaensis TaxID=130454 RepID=UPI0007AF98A7|nr:uncharacterized protein LOC107612282 [Arachis ipaensis]
MLKVDAEFWWDGARRLLEDAGTDISWATFKEAFYKKYFSLSVRESKKMEFLQLKQDRMSIAEYTEKFERLCKFSAMYKANPDKKWKCMKYQGGLRAEILTTIAPLEIREFSSLVSKCQVIEECTQKTSIRKKRGFQEKAAESRIFSAVVTEEGLSWKTYRKATSTRHESPETSH